MTAHVSLVRAELPQLRRRIISTYRRAQEIIAKVARCRRLRGRTA
jgi:hypothetical protein